MNPSPFHPLRRATAWLTDLVERKAASRTARQDDPASGTWFLVACCILSVVIVGLGGFAAFAEWDNRQEFASAVAAYDAQRVTEQKIRTAVKRYGPPATMSATYYGKAYHGRITSSGDWFDMHALTAAHRTLPFGTRLQVAYQGRQVEVVINDRGPMAWTGRDLDLSKAAFAQLAPTSIGVLQVQVREVLP